MKVFSSYDREGHCVVSMSGGLDSFVLAAYLVQELGKDHVHGVFLHYGQSNVDVTGDCLGEQVKYFVDRYGAVVEISLINGFPWHELNNYIENIDRETLYGRPDESDEIKKATFVSGRNSLIALAAMSLADTLDVSEAWLSVQIDGPEWSRVQEYLVRGPKDITPQWKDRMNILGEVSFQNLVRLRTPFLDLRWSKSDVVKLGLELDLDMSISYSCRYFPSCGKCQQCVIRQEFLGLPDWSK